MRVIHLEPYTRVIRNMPVFPMSGLKEPLVVILVRSHPRWCLTLSLSSLCVCVCLLSPAWFYSLLLDGVLIPDPAAAVHTACLHTHTQPPCLSPLHTHTHTHNHPACLPCHPHTQPHRGCQQARFICTGPTSTQGWAGKLTVYARTPTARHAVSNKGTLWSRVPNQYRSV